MSKIRNRAWRRCQNRLKKGKRQGTREKWKPEKNWKLLYLRSQKLNRAKQLGVDYPRINMRKLIERAIR